MKAFGRTFASIAAAATLGGCLATKYQMAPKDSLSAVPLGLAAEQPPLDLALDTVIVYKGPGSWKREALWDEYVVAIHNGREHPLKIDAVALLGAAGASSIPGDDPWNLEKESQTLEQRYLRAGVAFARSEIPDALVFGSSAVGGAAGTTFSAASATAASVGVIGLPVYYIIVFGVDRLNKAAVQKEFTRRRLVLPLTIYGGETQTGSFFFPMTPDPKSIDAQWSGDDGKHVLVLSLAPLRGLHDPSKVKPQAPASP
jgi:hypothetical protein